MNQPAPQLLDRAWAFLASERCTALIVISLSVFVLIGNVVPQGAEAVDMASASEATSLHEAAR